MLVDIFVNRYRGARVSDTLMWSGVLQERDQENKPREKLQLNSGKDESE